MKFNRKYIEDIKTVRGISLPRRANFPLWFQTRFLKKYFEAYEQAAWKFPLNYTFNQGLS